jgi:hypothetical protein
VSLTSAGGVSSLQRATSWLGLSSGICAKLRCAHYLATLAQLALLFAEAVARLVGKLAAEKVPHEKPEVSFEVV